MQPLRLHIGCGDQRLEGWVNVDVQPSPAVDVVLDVTKGLPFSNVELVFAEHFIEHLAVDEALDFLVEVHHVLQSDGWLRLSTPNLDWVWATHYRLDGSAGEKLTMGLRTNRAFRAWGHQFLWNRDTLDESLRACGFDAIRWVGYRESSLDALRGIERHETYGDAPGLPHVLVVEARKAAMRAAGLAELRRHIAEELVVHICR
ncbi:MAG TPA: hypothetical protein VGV61_09930 [Thermoanaerobaculia bacterium]|jgi:predicted SAM-dependent methyltransferase|nr:hypothetical protein [Thermoanaerobaculia bacterium]